MLLPALRVQNTHTHTHVRVCVLHVMEERLFGRLCPLSDSSVGHRSSRNIWDRVLACVSLSASSAVYCLPRVSHQMASGQPKVGKSSLTESVSRQILTNIFMLHSLPPLHTRLLGSHWQNSPVLFPNLNLTHILTLKSSLGGTDGSVPHKIDPLNMW